jgi:AcrR family transcriptional regulator
MSQPRTKKPDRPAPAQEPETGSTRERILSAAERLFAEQGYGNVSMPVIAAAAGITAGAIYKHFEGKEELFFHVVHRAVAAVHAVPAPGNSDLSLARLIANYTTERLKRARQLAIEMHYASVKHVTRPGTISSRRT